jgi:hypothetical protein
MEFYKQLDWPQVPKELLNQINFNQKTSIILNHSKRYLKDNEEIFAPLWAHADIESQDLKDWLLENITFPGQNNSFQQLRCQSTHLTHCEMIPHVDMERTYAFNYYIDTGGENTYTTWYKEKNQPLIRKVRPPIYKYPTVEGEIDYANLTELYKLQVIPNIWYWLRTDVVHGVKNLTGVRKYLSIY